MVQFAQSEDQDFENDDPAMRLAFPVQDLDFEDDDLAMRF